MVAGSSSSSVQPSRHERAQRRSRFRSCAKTISKNSRKAGTTIKTRSKLVWRGEETEEKKVVLRKSFSSAALRCWVHIVTLSATATLASLNLAGYFIGAQLQGLNDRVFQALDVLCLQVAAKLLEMLIVASCGTILLDVLQSHLLFGPEGLPIGILASQQRFKDINYLVSPEFRFGLAGFSNHWKRAWFGLFLLALVLISIFAGPSAATLMIPTQRSNWPAGGASFSLANDNDALWPSSLTASSIGGSHCQSPDMQMLVTDSINMSGCIWAGYSAYVQAFKETHLNDEIDLLIDDGMIRRTIIINARGMVAETWVYTSHLTVGMFAEDASTIAWENAFKTIPGSSPLHTLQYQAYNQSMGFVASWIPVVRTRCNIYSPAYFNDSGEAFEYPDLPEYDVNLDGAYWINTNYNYSSTVATRWVTVPDSAQLNDYTYTTDLPSALLNVQLPIANSTTTAVLWTCSIDARWAGGTNQGGPVGFTDVEYVETATIQNTRSPPDELGHSFNFLPVNDSSWRRVRMDMDWLSTLTPSFSSNNSVSDWTSLSSLLHTIGLDNSTGLIVEWGDIGPTLEVVIAVLVANGLSRQGYSNNIGNPTQIDDGNNLLAWDDSLESRASILAGTYTFPLPSPIGTTAAPPTVTTQLKLSITVTGFAYSADSAAYYLALTVLFVHAALALGHMIYLLITWRVFNDAWNSVVGLLLLAVVSGIRVPGVSSSSNSSSSNSNSNNSSSGAGAHQAFRNVGTGVEKYRTFSTRAYIRAVPSLEGASNGQAGAVEEDVALLFGEAMGKGLPAVKIGENYG